MSSVLTNLKARGFVVHPLNGKIPILPGWQKLTTTPPEAEKHFENGGNIGAVCGKVSDITAIDMDSFLFAPEIFGDFKIETLKAQRTEGRGHVYFKYNPRLHASKHHDIGIEILSDGNNIVMPPSVHPSGDMYTWKDPNAPIYEMPPEIEANLIQLFKTEAELKQMLAKTRHCFRQVIKKKPDMHGAEGREYMIAVSCDLKAKGATEAHICMFSKLMYDTKYDEGRTLQEWRNIDPAKTWTCDVLRAKLPAYVDLQECEKCEERKKKYQEAPRVIEPADNTDVGNGLRLVAKFGDKIRYCHPWKSWLCWGGKVWERDNTGQIFRYAKEMAEGMKIEADSMGATAEREKLYKHANASKSSTKIKAMVFLAESEQGMALLPDNLDANKLLFNVQNGTINLNINSERFRTFNKDDYITRISPAHYDGSAKSELWLTFVDTITCGDVDLARYLQKIAGQMLTGVVREKALYIFHGKKDTGKTTFVETIAHIDGEFAETMQIDSFMKKTRGGIPNDIAALKGKRFVFIDEPDFGDKLSEGLIKKLTGLGTISARFLNEEFFKFKPEFKIVVSCNTQPDITDKDQAIWGRVKCVPFKAKISKIDPDLQAKLRLEAAGILNWMIEGCLMWQKEGMNAPEAVNKATEEYKEDMDTLSDFFNVCCIKGNNYKIPHEYLYTAFKLWANAVQRIPMSKKAFTQICVDRDIDRTDTIMIGTRRHRGFIGITLSDWMFTSVHEFLTEPDNEKQILRTVCTHIFTFVHPAVVAFHACELNMCSMRSTCSGITNLCILPSVQSVQSVPSILLNQERIINKIKEVYNKENKPESLEMYARKKEEMIMSIIMDFDFEGIEEPFIKKVVDDYCHARSWE
jgi:putative DNA primase/helicase